MSSSLKPLTYNLRLATKLSIVPFRMNLLKAGMHCPLFNMHLAVFVFLITYAFSLKAQLHDSLSLDSITAYKSIAEANKEPEKVIKLVIHHQKFPAIPEDIRKYTNLQYLDLSKNHIKIVPSWIGELKSLQTLILSQNKIDSLPEEIGNLVNLKYFIMNRTDLASLPPEIGNLKELLYLDLWDDNLDDFPIDLEKLTKLRVLDLRDVSINDDEQAVIKSYLPHAIIFFSPGCQCRE